MSTLPVPRAFPPPRPHSALPSLRILVASAPLLVLVCFSTSGMPDPSIRLTSLASTSPSADLVLVPHLSAPRLLPQHLPPPRLRPRLLSPLRRPLRAFLPRLPSPLLRLPPPSLSLPPCPPSSSPAASHPSHPALQVALLLPTVNAVVRASLEPPAAFLATPARFRTTTTPSAFLARTRYLPLLLPVRPAPPPSPLPRALLLQTPW